MVLGAEARPAFGLFFNGFFGEAVAKKKKKKTKNRR